MADTRNSGRVKKYGVCLNDKCEKYKQVQEVVHGEMICPSCKKKLSPCAPPEPKKNKKPLIIGEAVVGVAIIAGGLFALTGGDGKSEALKAVVTDSIPAVDSTKTATETVVKTDTVVIRDTVVKEKTTTVEKNTTKIVKPRQGSGTLSLGYANYTGGTKNGKPHGQGRMTYKSSRLIDSRDSKGRTADPGDYVIGEWNNGKLVQGRWYGSDGNVKGSILIGM